MFQMSLFPQSSAVQQTMCQYVDSHIHATIQMGGRRAPSEMIIDQEQTQRDFIAENLDKQSDKSIDQLQKEWSDQQKLHDLNIPETKRRNRSKIDRVITDEQREALDEEYYGFFRGSVGMSTLWKTFNENNERQKASLEDGNKSSWVPWRTLQLYVSQQSTNQLMRDIKEPARTLAVIPTKSTMVPFKNMQIDSIVLRSNRDGRHAYIVNLVDSRQKFTQSECHLTLSVSKTFLRND